jgi:Flp pilus assembly secretin CpaC
MRRVSHPFLVLMAAAIATGTSAGAANPTAQKPVLRTSAASAAVPAMQKPALRASSAVMPAAKPVSVKVVVKPAVQKVVVVATHRPGRKHVVLRRASPSIAVPLDEVRVVAFSQPISTVYVGNPMIADVSMIDSRHAFVLGKSFGATNVVALDSNGKQVVNDPVNVFGHSGSTVILHRGTQQSTYACAGVRCESAPTPGDDKDSFSTRMEQLASHQDAGVKAASAH